MARFPCPRCRQQRRSLEAACANCHWTPLPVQTAAIRIRPIGLLNMQFSLAGSLCFVAVCGGLLALLNVVGPVPLVLLGVTAFVVFAGVLASLYCVVFLFAPIIVLLILTALPAMDRRGALTLASVVGAGLLLPAVFIGSYGYGTPVLVTLLAALGWWLMQCLLLACFALAMRCIESRRRAVLGPPTPIGSGAVTELDRI